MKKLLLQVFAIVTTVAIVNKASAQVRYLDPVFSSVNKTSNIEYDSNRSLNILYGTPYPIGNQPFITFKLKCDIYEPAGDTVTNRPLIIMLSTGSYLPPIINRQTTGSKDDSSIVEMCTRFAQKGYVVVAMNYRSGWNAATTVQADAAEQLIKVTYRALQDVRNCVRFMKSNASTYKINTNKICVGGQGTGGYIVLGLATIDKRSEIESNPKFQRSNFSPMVSVDTLGDWKGIGGAPYFNYSGDPTINSDVQMVFNYGGALADSAWLEANSLPMIGIQSKGDIFAPYNTGNVVVPTTGITVIPNASGAGDFIPSANAKGVNTKMNAKNYTDPFTVRAMQASGGVKAVFPFITSFPIDGSPWEWWDIATAQAITAVMYQGYPVPANGRAADSLSRLTNPTMSAAKARAYIDTIQGFVCPRIATQLDLISAPSTSVKEISNINNILSVYPNPANTNVNISVDITKAGISEINLMDVAGKIISTISEVNAHDYNLNLSNMSQGIYFVNVKLTNGVSATKRLMIN